MSKKQKLAILIKNTKSLEEIKEIEKLLEKNLFTENLLDQKLKNLNK